MEMAGRLQYGMRLLSPLAIPALAALFASVPAAQAQGGSYVLHNFQQHGAGQYRQESQGYVQGKPMGQPVTDTHCAAALAPQNAAEAKQMGNTAAAMSNCSTRVLVDTPTLATAQQTCNPGAMQTVILTTMRALDENTITMETAMTTGGQPGMTTRSKVTYLGACTAAQNAENARAAAAPMPAMPKPSKAECAEMAEMKQQAQEAQSSNACSGDMPANIKARCEASMQIMQQRMKQMEALCK